MISLLSLKTDLARSAGEVHSLTRSISCIWVKEMCVPKIAASFAPDVIPPHGFKAEVLALSCCDWVTSASIIFNKPLETGSDNSKENVKRGERSDPHSNSALAG